jgi:hypothetical protein
MAFVFRKGLVLPDRPRSRLGRVFGKTIQMRGLASNIRKGDRIFAVGDIVVRTLLRNGYSPSVAVLDYRTARGRIMCLYRKHTKKLAPLVRRKVMAEFRNFCIQYFFSYTNSFSIHKDTFSTMPGHWHVVASDLDKKAEDYRQILKTPRTEYRLKTRDVEV